MHVTLCGQCFKRTDKRLNSCGVIRVVFINKINRYSQPNDNKSKYMIQKLDELTTWTFRLLQTTYTVGLNQDKNLILTKPFLWLEQKWFINSINQIETNTILIFNLRYNFPRAIIEQVSSLGIKRRFKRCSKQSPISLFWAYILPDYVIWSNESQCQLAVI